ncbi:MAG: AAA family ATPase [Bifidobacterium dentium]
MASHANHGIVFLDTDAMVTRVYAERYLADETPATSRHDMVIQQEKPDLVLLIPPITEYVDDGFRTCGEAGSYRFHETLVRVRVTVCRPW